ncbi:MAG: response regulator, partial [Acidobacteriota bacterium]
LKQFAPDLVLADVFMPGRNGYELCQLVKSDPDLQHIPVVLIIGKMEPYDETEGRKARADAVITKPLESSSLIETVRRLLAAVQKPAPPPAPPEPASIEEPPKEEPGEEDIPSPEAERMWTSAKEQLEIPDELGTQAFSVFGDLLESSDEAAPEANLSPETPAMEMELEAAPSPKAFSIEPETVPPVVAESAIAFEETPVEQEPATADTPAGTSFPSDTDSGSGSGSIQLQEVEEPASQKEFIPESPPAKLQETEERVWTAEPVAATEEDEKLFEPPPPLDWEKLTKTEEAEIAEVEEAKTPPARLSGDQPEPTASAEVPAESLPVSNTLPDAPPAEEKSDPAERTNFIPEIPEVEAAIGEDTLLLDPVSVSSPPPPEEAEQEITTSVDPAAIEKLVRESAEDMMPQITDRIVRTMDTATIKELVRKSLEDMLPQIVDRIVRSVEITLRREQE